MNGFYGGFSSSVIFPEKSARSHCRIAVNIWTSNAVRVWLLEVLNLSSYESVPCLVEIKLETTGYCPVCRRNFHEIRFILYVPTSIAHFVLSFYKDDEIFVPPAKGFLDAAIIRVVLFNQLYYMYI